MSRDHITHLVRSVWRSAIVLLLLCPLLSYGQSITPKYTIDDGRMVIKLDIHIPDSTLNNFIHNYNLSDLDLEGLIKKDIRDSLIQKGWDIHIKKNGIIIISKQLNELKSTSNTTGEKPEKPEKPEVQERNEEENWMEIVSSLGNVLSGGQANAGSNLSGANHFRTLRSDRLDSTTTFYLAGHQDAAKVLVAGSFTNWTNDPIIMQKIAGGWAANVKLGPGKYFYKFIVGAEWLIDDDNLLIENDGDGNDNSVYFKPNTLFTLAGHQDAKRVVLSGSFNSWAPDDIAMTPTQKGWQTALYLSPGSYTYRFVVDGNWMIDPANKLKTPNEYNDFNSFISVGSSYTFRLNGNTDAKDVVLSGSFNNWQPNQLHMIKTPSGWEFPYALGPGNYEYKFIVDGNWITDPANPLIINGQNSYLVLAPNHTFRLKGFTDAKKVYLMGDFDSWSNNTLQMIREGNDWIYSVYLTPGKHLYKFVVDGNAIKDPENPLWEDQDNSIIWQDK